MGVDMDAPATKEELSQLALIVGDVLVNAYRVNVALFGDQEPTGDAKDLSRFGYDTTQALRALHGRLDQFHRRLTGNEEHGGE